MILETGLQMMREDLQLSQKNVAEAMGISQPAITQVVQLSNELKIATINHYIEAMGGKLSLAREFRDMYLATSVFYQAYAAQLMLHGMRAVFPVKF